jgi:hypothetical protein
VARPGGAGPGVRGQRLVLSRFTTASARIPGSNSSSSAASRVMRDTNRCGPDWISTWAATPSFVTFVTIPVNRFRADCPRRLSRCGPAASSVANLARSAPSMYRRPAGPTIARTLPASAHRRIVSELTPRISAACPIRNSVTATRYQEVPEQQLIRLLRRGLDLITDPNLTGSDHGQVDAEVIGMNLIEGTEERRL